jgi:RHS repeat-associated protein
VMLYREEVRDTPDRDTTFYLTDLWGQVYQNQDWHHWHKPWDQTTYTYTRTTNSFYDAERRLASTQYSFDSLPPLPDPHYISTETYRYDALGRRVYAREVRGPACATQDRASGCLSTLTRTIWDGDQILYETRAQGDSGNLELENDAPAPSSYYGVVGYLHAGGIDQPIALWKGAGDLVLPFANWRGEFVRSLCPSTDCGSAVYLPANGATAFGDPPFNPNKPTIWHGSLLEAGQDQSGLQYRRNRYYDPSTGRFTQEDPLGLGGGLNLYGFASGDPVSFDDPFGLCPVPPDDCPWGSQAGQSATEHWATVAATSNNGWVRAGATALGLFSALWTPETAEETGMTLVGAGAMDLMELPQASPAAGVVAVEEEEPQVSEAARETPASTPVGRRGAPLDVVDGSNSPAVINGRTYSGHALDRMQARGLTPSVVEDAIANGASSPGRGGSTIYTTGQARVIVNARGVVVTAMPR